MTASTSVETHVNCLITRTALGVNGKSVQNRLETLLEKNGVEWTVNRLKTIYNAALHLRNGDLSSARKLYQENSIAYNDKGYPRDPFGLVVKTFVETDRPSVIKKMSGVLRLYTQYTHEELTLKQAETIVSSLTEENPYAPGNHTYEALPVESTMYRYTEELINRRLGGKSYDVRNYNYDVRDLNPFTATHILDSRIDPSMRDIPYMNVVNSMSSNAYLPKSLDSQIPSIEMRIATRERNQELGLPNDISGRIHVIQEGGLKPRFVAIPNSWIQYSFVPVHKAMQDFTRRALPEYSGMDDQNHSAFLIKEHMDKGHPVFAVDLSKATDRFPIKLQTNVLRLLGLEDHASALEEISKGKWEFPQVSRDEKLSPLLKGTNGYISYREGQPMGLYGSFPLFHACHILFAKSAQNYGNGETKEYYRDQPLFSNGTAFQVLGDDIVFSNPKSAYHYKLACSNYAIPISESKSFSGHLSEFAGFIFTKAKQKGISNKENTIAFRPYKAPAEGYISNPLPFMESFGQAPSKKPRWRRLENAFRRTRSQRKFDLSPVYNSENPDSHTRGNNLRTIEDAAQNLYRYNPERYTFDDGRRFLDLRVEKTITTERQLLAGFPMVKRSDLPEEQLRRTSVRNLSRDPLIREFLEREKDEKLKQQEEKPVEKVATSVKDEFRDNLKKVRKDSKTVSSPQRKRGLKL